MKEIEGPVTGYKNDDDKECQRNGFASEEAQLLQRKI